MRKAMQKERKIKVADVNRYHGGNFRDEGYAFEGFESLKYFASDRPEECGQDEIEETSFRMNGKPMKGYGLEIETECWSVTNTKALANIFDKIIFPMFSHDLFKMQSDASLHGGESSVECITQVMTKEYIRNQYANFKAMYNDYFKMFDISATKSGNCGMHVNISVGNFGTTEAKQHEAIRKLYYIINKHYDFCCPLFNRKNDYNHTHYCQRMDYSIARTMDLHRMPASHGISFNGSHIKAGRIEIRLVGGQKNFGCFRNTMECIFHLVDAVKRISWNDCDDITKIFSGCNQYVFDRLKTTVQEEGQITDAQLAKIERTVINADLI